MESLPPARSPDLSPTPSPYITAPSSPKYFSDFSSDDPPDADVEIPNFTVPLDNGEEDKPEVKISRNSFEEDDDITFEFCVDQFQSFSLPAEDLFDGGVIRPLKPPPAAQIGAAEFSGSASPIKHAAAQIRRPVIIWPARRSYDFDAFETTLERGKTASFGGSKPGKFSRLRNLLSFRRSSMSERASNNGSKASTSFGSSGSSSSGSGPGVRSVSGSGRDPDDVARKSLAPCKQRLLSCFVKRL